MLIVLRDGPHLELGRTQASVHTEIPVGTQPAVSYKVEEVPLGFRRGFKHHLGAMSEHTLLTRHL